MFQKCVEREGCLQWWSCCAPGLLPALGWMPQSFGCSSFRSDVECCGRSCVTDTVQWCLQARPHFSQLLEGQRSNADPRFQMFVCHDSVLQ